MKVTVSLPEEDVEVLDAYAKDHGITSRSAVVRKAVRLLRDSTLGADYEDAWATWSADDNELWQSVAARFSGEAGQAVEGE